MEFQYSTSAASQNGRNGTVTVENSPLTFQMASPLAMGGKDDTGVNPEQLFAAGYAACFGSALHHVIPHKEFACPLTDSESYDRYRQRRRWRLCAWSSNMRCI